MKSEGILLFESSGLNEFVGKSWLQGSAELRIIRELRVKCSYLKIFILCMGPG